MRFFPGQWVETRSKISASENAGGDDDADYGI